MEQGLHPSASAPQQGLPSGHSAPRLTMSVCPGAVSAWSADRILPSAPSALSLASAGSPPIRAERVWCVCVCSALPRRTACRSSPSLRAPLQGAARLLWCRRRRGTGPGDRPSSGPLLNQSGLGYSRPAHLTYASRGKESGWGRGFVEKALFTGRAFPSLFPWRFPGALPSYHRPPPPAP